MGQKVLTYDTQATAKLLEERKSGLRMMDMG